MSAPELIGLAIGLTIVISMTVAGYRRVPMKWLAVAAVIIGLVIAITASRNIFFAVVAIVFYLSFYGVGRAVRWGIAKLTDEGDEK